MSPSGKFCFVLGRATSNCGVRCSNSSTARSRKNETRNGHGNGNWNLEWSKFQLSFQVSRLKRDLTIQDSGFNSDDHFEFHLFGNRLRKQVQMV